MRTGNEIEWDVVKIVEGLARGLTRFRDDLQVSEVDTLKTITVSITAHADDTPKLIGSQGCTFKALRKILEAIAAPLAKRGMLVVTDPVTGQKFSQEKFSVDTSYEPDDEIELLEQIGWAICDGKTEVQWVRTNDQSGTFILLLDSAECDYDPELEVALDTIFSAIGKAKGQILHVELDSL